MLISMVYNICKKIIQNINVLHIKKYLICSLQNLFQHNHLLNHTNI